MSFLNSTLLNGDYFQAGSGASKYISPIGTVVVSGTLRATLGIIVRAATECRATATGHMTVKRGLRVAQIVRAKESTFVFDTTHKGFKGSTPCTLATDGQLAVKRSLWANRTATVASRLLATQIKTLTTGQPAQAVGAVKLGAYLGLGAANENKAGSHAQLTTMLACYGGAVASASTSGLLVRGRALQASQVASVFCYSNLEERDTRPASTERRMIVPYENRTMEVI